MPTISRLTELNSLRVRNLLFRKNTIGTTLSDQNHTGCDKIVLIRRLFSKQSTTMPIEKKQIKKKIYKIVKPVGENDKCPPQARLIVNTITTAGGSMSREDLLEALKKSPAEGGLTTRQTPERILGFYSPKLEELGVMELETQTVEVEVEVPEKKPKKGAKSEEGAAESAAS